MLIDFESRDDGMPVYSFSDVFRGAVPASDFAGKLVLIGGTSNSEPDTYETPVDGANRVTYNVQIQADLADMVVSQPPHLLRDQDPLDQIAMIILFSLFAGVTLPHFRPTYAVALTILYLLALFLVAVYSFAGGLIVRVLYPGLALVLTLLVVGGFRYASEERRRNFLTTLFRRYVPAESVGRVVDAIDRGELPLRGARRIVTVLYADLRGFSVFSDGLAPETVLELVNRYLELMMREILEEHGTVSKPMGDALIAIWNAPLDQPDHALRAARTAIAIRRRMSEIQDTNAEGQMLNLGMGLATGWGILGNINLLGKVEYTLIGETVNLASRIGAYAGNHQILAEEATVRALPPGMDLHELSPIRVRGHKEPLAIWELSEQMEGLVEQEEFEE
jgi:adenylate cyclase